MSELKKIFDQPKKTRDSFDWLESSWLTVVAAVFVMGIFLPSDSKADEDKIRRTNLQDPNMRRRIFLGYLKELRPSR